MIDISNSLAGTQDTAATGRRCKFGQFLDALSTEHRAEIVRRLHGNDWTDAKLAKLIGATEFGHVAQSLLSTHRAGVCICDTTTENEAA